MQLAHLRSPVSRMLRDHVIHHLPAPLRRRLLEQVTGLDVDYAPPSPDRGDAPRPFRRERGCPTSRS